MSPEHLIVYENVKMKTSRKGLTFKDFYSAYRAEERGKHRRKRTPHKFDNRFFRLIRD
jgi:hypothetical protein